MYLRRSSCGAVFKGNMLYIKILLAFYNPSYSIAAEQLIIMCFGGVYVKLPVSMLIFVPSLQVRGFSVSELKLEFFLDVKFFFSLPSSTFEFGQLISQLGSCQLMDVVRHRVLVVQRLVACVGDGGAVQQGDVTGAVKQRKANTHYSVITFQMAYWL